MGGRGAGGGRGGAGRAGGGAGAAGGGGRGARPPRAPPTAGPAPGRRPRAAPRRVFFGKNSVVVPFLLGENLLINLRGKGKPVDAIKILPNGINVQRYGFHPGSETINVYGDVVRP